MLIDAFWVVVLSKKGMGLYVLLCHTACILTPLRRRYKAEYPKQPKIHV